MAIFLSKQLLWHALVIASPIVCTAVICGLIISFFQALTQIQDSTLSLAPKILAMVLSLMFCGEWMLHSLLEFAQTIIHSIPETLQ